MFLYELLSNLNSKVPIKVVEISPPEHPEAFQDSEVIYDSEKSYLYGQYRIVLDHMLMTNYLVNDISLCDTDYMFRLYITVVRV